MLNRERGENGTASSIIVLPRKSAFMRRAVGYSRGNADCGVQHRTVLILHVAGPRFQPEPAGTVSFRRLDSGALPVVVLTKGRPV